MEKITVSEGAQTSEDKYCMFFLICGFLYQKCRYVCLACHACRSQRTTNGLLNGMGMGWCDRKESRRKILTLRIFSNPWRDVLVTSHIYSHIYETVKQ